MAMEKMIIKLKLPQGSNELSFSCPICSKSFRCGKALGGHKRVHFLKKTSSDRCGNLLQITNAENQDNTCPVCARSFVSEKSVHGHMRKHPDRGWRGMVPPREQQNLENGTVPRPLLLLPPVPDPVHAPPPEEHVEKEYDPTNQNPDMTSLPAWPRGGRRSRLGKAPMEDRDQVLVKNQGTMCVVYEPDAGKQHFSVPKKKKMMEFLTSSGGGKSSQGKKYGVRGNPGPRQKKNVCNNSNVRSSGEKDENVGPLRGSTAALSGNKETRKQSAVFEFDLNELPREWNH